MDHIDQNKQMMTGNLAAAWGARLADVDYVPAFPITPQTEIVETLSKWCANSALNARFVTLDSEHSMMTAAGAAAATGARVFTATSSQGLLHAFEVLYTVAGWRVPFVLVNVSRAVASPITLEPDHNDVLAARDAGFVQIHAETCQEIVDSILIAYRIAEDPRVCLPAIVNLDGFILSFTREPVVLPGAEDVAQFLPPFRPSHLGFKASAPHALGTAVLGGSTYSYFRHQIHLASVNALHVHEEAAVEFERLFGRRYPSGTTWPAVCGSAGSESLAGAGWDSFSGDWSLSLSRTGTATGTLFLYWRSGRKEYFRGRVSCDLRADGGSGSPRQRNRTGVALYRSRASRNGTIAVSRA